MWSLLAWSIFFEKNKCKNIVAVEINTPFRQNCMRGALHVRRQCDWMEVWIHWMKSPHILHCVCSLFTRAAICPWWLQPVKSAVIYVACSYNTRQDNSFLLFFCKGNNSSWNGCAHKFRLFISPGLRSAFYFTLAHLDVYPLLCMHSFHFHLLKSHLNQTFMCLHRSMSASQLGGFQYAVYIGLMWKLEESLRVNFSSERSRRHLVSARKTLRNEKY